MSDLIPIVVNLYRLYKEMKHAQELEHDAHQCLSYANLILRLSLQIDLDSYEEAEKKKRRKIEEAEAYERRGGSYTHNLLTGEQSPLTPMQVQSQPLDYKQHSGQLNPYHESMQELHNNMSSQKEALVKLAKRKGKDLDLSFLDWETYGCVFPNTPFTTLAFGVMQGRYYDLFELAHEHLVDANERIREYIFILLEIPILGNYINTRLAIVNREHIATESKRLRERYKAHADKITRMSRRLDFA